MFPNTKVQGIKYIKSMSQFLLPESMELNGKRGPHLSVLRVNALNKLLSYVVKNVL